MTPKQPPGLVIFDCDGVLVNSEPIFNRVLHAFLLSSGASLTFDACCARFTGKSRHAVEVYLAEAGLPVPDDWPQAFYDRALDALAREVTEIPGARDVVGRLVAANVPVCVASNGLMAKMQVTLGRTGMATFFEGRMYSAYEIGDSKPAPDVFLHAARAHGVAPADCVVVEDSASGFAAAFNAGMRCLAYLPPDGPPAPNLHGARPFHAMSDLPGLLGVT